MQLQLHNVFMEHKYSSQRKHCQVPNGILGFKRMSKNFNLVFFKLMKICFYYPSLMKYFKDHYALRVCVMMKYYEESISFSSCHPAKCCLWQESSCPEILFCSYKVSYSVVSKFSYESVKWGESRINQGLTWKRKKKCQIHKINLKESKT